MNAQITLWGGKYLPGRPRGAFIAGAMILYIGSRKAGEGAVLAEENE
jgi:fumarate hydratase class II